MRTKDFSNQHGVLGIIGSGNFTSSTLLPKLTKTGATIKSISSSRGLSSTILAKKYGIANSTTDYSTILDDNEIDLILITTRHNSHAKLIIESLNAGKSVFVEKPLALNQRELNEIIKCYTKNKGKISVGFNRRFAPIAEKIKKALGNNNIPINIIANMNAGFIPKESWVHDMTIGGGRIIGEACHFIDLCSYLSGSKVISVCMNTLGLNQEENTDNASILLKYENGANAVINYFSNGSKSYSKERLEIYSNERTIIMDNWRKLTFYGFKYAKNYTGKQDKGHLNQFQKLVENQKKGGEPIIPFDSLINTTQASFAAIQSLREKKWISIK